MRRLLEEALVAFKGSVIDAPFTVTVCLVGTAASHHSELLSVMRTPIRCPAANFQSADIMFSVIGPLARMRCPWRLTSGALPVGATS